MENTLHLSGMLALMDDDTQANVPGSDRSLRADAERNRQRIVEAARSVFAERGLDAPLDAIAERAGVGQATLYRRFPRREDLIVACFAPKLTEYADGGGGGARRARRVGGVLRLYGACLRRCRPPTKGVQDVLTTTFPTDREWRRSARTPSSGSPS